MVAPARLNRRSAEKGMEKAWFNQSLTICLKDTVFRLNVCRMP